MILPGGATATAVAADVSHTRALGSDGHVYAWGLNGNSTGGRLASGTGGSATGAQWFSYGLGTDNQVWEHVGTGGATGGWSKVMPQPGQPDRRRRLAPSAAEAPSLGLRARAR